MGGLLHPSQLLRLRRRIYMLIAAAGLGGLLLLLLNDSQASLTYGLRTAAAPTAAVRPLTTGTAMDGFGGWSPDGKQIAFMRDGQIWLMEAGGKGGKALTQNAAVWDAVPAWRPDGKAIGFARISMDGGSAYIMEVDPASGKERQVAKVAEPVGHVAWDPSGRSIYFSTERRLHRVDARSGKVQQLVEVEEGWEMQAGGVAVTPDGKSLIFGAGPRMGRQVLYDLWSLQLGAAAAEPERLTTGGGIMPVLDRAGKQLAYRNPRQKTGIYLMDLKTHATRLVVADEKGAMYFHPAFAPDGKTLLLSRLLLSSAEQPGADGRQKLTSHLYLHTLTGSGGD